MPDEMSLFRVDIAVENPSRPGERRRFRQADGTILERWTGPAFVHVAGKRTADDVGLGSSGIWCC